LFGELAGFEAEGLVVDGEFAGFHKLLLEEHSIMASRPDEGQTRSGVRP
jgi:hypothetical protein